MKRLNRDARFYWSGYLSALCATPAAAAAAMICLNEGDDHGATVVLAARDTIDGKAHEIWAPPGDYDASQCG